MKWDVQSSSWDTLVDEFDEDLFDDAANDLRHVETSLQDNLGPQWDVKVVVRVRPAGSSG